MFSKFCPNCGAASQPVAKFCSECGGNLSVALSEDWWDQAWDLLDLESFEATEAAERIFTQALNSGFDEASMGLCLCVLSNPGGRNKDELVGLMVVAARYLENLPHTSFEKANAYGNNVLPVLIMILYILHDELDRKFNGKYEINAEIEHWADMAEEAMLVAHAFFDRERMGDPAFRAVRGRVYSYVTIYLKVISLIQLKSGGLTDKFSAASSVLNKATGFVTELPNLSLQVLGKKFVTFDVGVNGNAFGGPTS